MNITFSNYKGFLCGGGSPDGRVDLRKYLPQISNSQPSGRKENTGKSSTAGSVEYRTDGFDLLASAWSLQETGSDGTELHLLENSVTDGSTQQRILCYGNYLRNLCFQSAENNESPSSKGNDQLSSHTTLYGEEVLEGSDTGALDEDAPSPQIPEMAKTPIRDKKKRLTPDERKLLRQQAREMKRNARLAKTQEKKGLHGGDLDLGLDLVPSTNCIGSRSKAKHLRFLINECIKAATITVGGSKLSDTTKVSQIDDVTLYITDLKNLQDDEWLSDSNISWVYAFLYHGYLLPLLSESLKSSKFYQYKKEKEEFVSPICLLLPTFTFLIANNPDPEDLLTCNVLPNGISDAQIVFCPLNDNDDFGCSEGGSHWSLVVFFKLQPTGVPSKTAYIQKALAYDSMFQANASETERLVHNMAKVLYNPKDPRSKLEWDIVHVRDSPQQTNGSDCGVYVAAITSFLVSQLVALTGSSTRHAAAGDPFVDLSLKSLRFNAIDSRIWMLSTLLNFLKNPKID